MKKLLFLTISFCSLHAYAQDEFHNYSELQIKSKGTIYITETDSLFGEIYYSELTSGRVTLTGSDGKENKYFAKDIFGFKTQTPPKAFLPLKSNGIDKSMLFYENITPNDGDKLLLVKAFVSDIVNIAVVVNETVKGTWELSIYDKAQQKILGSSIKKIAERVKDCSTLYEKINNKEDGYTYGFIAPPLIVERVYKNIVTVYNSCNVKR